ncbi:MAG: flagellar basal body-associated FliL family protein [Kangiellaceae bacterium]|nr:flagellar basal body-associated FliL family protein [Kangiellaceae bacterium]
MLLLILVFTSTNTVCAEEDEGDEEETKEALMYFEVEPNILTFYQGTGRKIGYVVVQVNLAVRGQDNYDLVELHLPLIQDNLIEFFNQQDKTVIQPFTEREQLRLKAMESVSIALTEETGKDLVENLLFTNYVYQ